MFQSINIFKILLESVLLGSIVIGMEGQVLTQESLVSAGDTYESGGSSVSWSLGEVISGVGVNNETILMQGFNQSEIIITALAFLEPLSNEHNAYPNPTKDYVIVDFDPRQIPENIVLIDAIGRVLLSESVKAGDLKVEIDFKGYNNGVYRLYMSGGQGELVRQFNILKIGNQ